MPDPTSPGEITRLLHEHLAGDEAAFDVLVSFTYDQLRRIAKGQLRRTPRSGTLDTVALVNEAYLRLARESGIDWQDRSHFYGVMARAMRFVVVDHARRRSAQKRGSGERPVTLDADRHGAAQAPELVLAVDDAMERLTDVSPRLATLVEYRFFAGMTEPEIASALDLSERTVQRDWRRARAWLQRFLDDEADPAA